MDPAAAVSMRMAMRHWQPTDEAMVLDGPMLMGECRLHTGSQPSLSVSQPLRLGDLTMVADAFIHDRHGLRDRLRQRKNVDKHACDEELLLNSYLAFGISGLEAVRGDFSAAIFDHRAGELILFRDVMGVRPLFYMELEGLLIFASEPRGILAHPKANAAIDEEFVCRMLAGLPPDPSSTFHRYVRILPPGHCLRVDKDSVTLRRYTGLSIPDSMSPMTSDEAYAKFREVFREAVSCRMAGDAPFAVELSGGLDSSAITCMAASLMSDRRRLHVFSNVLPEHRPSVLDDESAYIREIVAYADLQKTFFISGSDRTDFRPALDVDLEVNGGVEYMTSSWLEPFRRLMQERDIHVVLSGFGGDQGASHTGRNHWVDLADEGRWVAFLTASIKNGRPGMPVRRILKGILPERVVAWLRNQKADESRGANYLRKDIPLRPMVSERGSPSAGRFPYKQHLIWTLSGPTFARRLQNEALYGIRHRITPRYPMLDVRLLELLLSLPASLLGHPSTARYFFRQSMQGILPDLVRLRNDKDVPSGVYFLEENRRFSKEVRNWIDQIRRHVRHPLLDFIDFDRLMEDLNPDNPRNQWKGEFYPAMPFHLQALLRFCEQSGNAPE